jgi:hypothetical protein
VTGYTKRAAAWQAAIADARPAERPRVEARAATWHQLVAGEQAAAAVRAERAAQAQS